MRKIIVDPPDSDIWRRWLADCEKATMEISELADIKAGRRTFTMAQRAALKEAAPKMRHLFDLDI